MGGSGLPELCGPAEFAGIAGLSADNVRRMCERGELAACKVGGKWVINVDRSLGGAAPVRGGEMDVERLASMTAAAIARELSRMFSASAGRM